MPIKPLPDDTVRLLGSASVIATPVGLVKELLENAIDAGATSIDTLISQDTVDRIEVRDNGSGILPDDYECLGHPGHTSKLTTFEELRTIGANTLGFRGQALASANTLGNVVVTTRTLQDPTATKLKLRHGVGGVENQERTSAPVGTVVSVTALFSRLPVRQQVILKEAKKIIVDIRHLLHAYALARPQIRLSFRVIGGNPKQSWSYSPRPQATVQEAVVQVFGTGVMSQCTLQTLATEIGIETDVSHDGPELVIEAVLPNPDADLSRLSKGSFLSIDSRPITTLRGTGRHLMKIFRTHIEKAWGAGGAPRASNNLFTRVNIKCSPGTYDPNIEPSKDQVIFSNESQVTNLFERLCTGVYRAQETPSVFVTIEKRPIMRRTQTRTPPPSSDGPERDKPSTLDASVDLEGTAGGGATQPPWSPMSSQSSPLRPHLLRTDTKSTQQPNGTRHPRDIPFPRSTFPLTTAMLGGSISQVTPRTRQPHLGHASTEDIIVGPQDTHINHSRMNIEGIRNEQFESATDLRSSYGVREVIPCQTVTDSNQIRKRGFVVDMSAGPDMSSDEETEMLASRFRGMQDKNSQLEEYNEHSEEGLDPWVIAKMTAPTRQPIASGGISVDVPQSLSNHQEPANFGIDETSEEELPVLRSRGLGESHGDPGPAHYTHTGILQVDRREAQGIRHLNPAANTETFQTFSSPSDHGMPGPPLQPAKPNGRHSLPHLRGYRDKPDENVDADGLVQSKLSFGGPREMQKKHNAQPQVHINDVPARPNAPFRKPRRLNAVSHGGQDPQTSGSSVDARLDNRHQKDHSGGLVKDATLAMFSQSSRLAASISPESHLARHPQAPNPDARNVVDMRIDEDPREYLIKRQRSEAGQRGRARPMIKRTKTDKLPLETIPRGHEIQRLVLVVKPDRKSLERKQEGVEGDEAAETGGLCAGMYLEDVAEVEERLKYVISVWTDNTLGEKAEVDINLRRVVKGKDVAT